MIAHIWKTIGNGWLLELSIGNSIDGFKVISETTYPSKAYAKDAARKAGAQPWNY